MLGYGLLLLLSLGAMVAAVLWHDRDVRYRHGQVQVSAIAKGAERELRHELRYLERGLEGLATDAREFAKATPERAAQLLALRIAGIERRNPDLREIGLSRVLPDDPGLGTSGTDAARSAGRLRIGHPRKRDGVGWVLPLAMPIPNAGAGEPSWVIASLRVGALEQVAAGLDLGSDGIANIMHRDGWMVVRSRDQARWVGAPLRDTDLFRQHVPRAPAGVFDLASPLDGKTRIAAYRVLPDYPLLVVAGIARKDALAGWGTFAITAGVLGSLLALLWGALLRVQMRSRWQQRQLLKSLQHSAEQLKETRRIASVGDSIWEVDSGWVTWSEEVYRIHGLEPQAQPFRAENDPTIIHPDDRQRVGDRLAQVLAGSEPGENQYRIVRADGAVRTIYLRAEWVDRTPGQRVMRAVQQDITALAAVRHRLNLAQEIAQIGDWEWDIATGEILWSDAVYSIYGLDPHSFQPRADNVFQYIHADDRPRMQAFAAALVETGKPCEAEFRMVRPDGAVRVISCRGTRESAPDGGLIIRSVQQDITELAHARDGLRTAEAQYRFLFEHNPLPMWVFDRETLTFLEVNDAMLESYGYAREELLGAEMLRIRPPEDAAAVLAAAKLDSSQRPQGRVWTHLRKDGASLRVAMHTRDIEFDGRPARLVLALDVTERERSEQRFQLVARATSDAVYDLEMASGQLWWSDSFYSQFGYVREDVPATLQAWEALLHPGDRARINASLELAIADPTASEWEERYRFIRGDGSFAEVVDRGFLLRDGQGQMIRMVGGMLDVTEKHQQAIDLRLLRRAVESTENGVVIADARLPDLPVVYVNAAFERITGYSPDEVLGRNCRFLLGDDTDQIGRLEIRRGIEQGHEARALLRNYRKDGALFWNDLHVNPVRDDAGLITHFVGVLVDVSERQRYQDQIAHRATHDELTGLPNRTLLQDRLQQAIAAAARFGGGVSVAFIDLDNFKLINDGLGHASGDLVLRAVATRLAACIRDADTVGRFGGDEFVLVISEQADHNGIARVIERVEAAFAEPVDIGGAQHYLTGSIGYCCYPQHGHDAETLLMHADIAMYEAKRAGRDRAIEYRGEFETGVSERLFLVSRLREALSHNEFVLHFQPLFSADGPATGLEALIRWQHPDQGLLPPGRFISACENSGLIVPLGRWVLREAARHHALLAAQGLAHLTISINVSALQFQPGLLDDVEAAMEGHNLPPGALEIELTESAVMADPEAAIAIMNQLEALGISIAVDDFGTGYSSLAYLKRLPISRLKIDQSFVRDLGQDEDDEAICASIIALARSLKLGTVAEGVETEDQRRWLLEHGCDVLQGYLLGRPVPFDEVVAKLTAQLAESHSAV